MNVTEISTSDSAPHVYECYCERQILAAISCITAALGLFGNILVILAIITTKRLQTRTNAFVFNLSVADVLTCSLLPLNAVAFLSDEGYILPNGVCVFNAFMLIVCVGTSVNTLACIALNRLVRITQPLHNYTRVYKTRNIFLMLLLVWSHPVCVALIPVLTPLTELGYEPRYSICLWILEHEGSFLYVMLVALACYPVQLLVTFYSYVKVFYYVNKTSKKLLVLDKEELPSLSQNVTRSSRNRSSTRLSQASTRFRQVLFHRQVTLTKNLFFILCAFLICLTPYVITILMSNSGQFIPYAATWLTVNSCLNPMIYAAKHPDFKKSMLSLLRPQRKY